MTRLTKATSFIVLIILISGALTPLAIAISEAPIQDSPESLSFIILKMTGEEYIMLKNNGSTDIDDLSLYSLKAFNNYNPLASNVSVTTQALPSVGLKQSETLMLSSTIRPTCGASLAGKLSVSLVDGSGRVEILKNLVPGQSGTPEILDSVNWSSLTVSEIKSVPSSTKAPLAVYYRTQINDKYTWQIAEAATPGSCLLKVALTGSIDKGQITIKPDDLLSIENVIIETVFDEVAVDDKTLTDGLLPIQLTELLPNPTGTGNDLTEEYIELYNPNDKAFDLSGYKLQTGMSRLYDFTLKPGTILLPQSHKAFYSADTRLSLSNTSGQARLLSPTNQLISSTDIYRFARDGQSWSLVDNYWDWSDIRTPNALNIISKPKLKDKKSMPPTTNLTKKLAREPSAKASKPAKTPKTLKKPKPTKPKKIKVEKTTKYSSGPTEDTLITRPVQTKLVATVGSVAVLYGAYEYRSSLANGFYKLRRKFSFGRSDRG